MSFPALPRAADLAAPGPAALIVVGVDWCGHCQTFKKDLKNFALPPGVNKVYWVDGDNDARAQSWKIDGYPTTFYKPSSGGLYKHAGDRSNASINRFISSLER